MQFWQWTGIADLAATYIHSKASENERLKWNKNIQTKANAFTHTRTNRSYVYECVHCTICIAISNLICRKRLKSNNNSSSNNHNRIHSQTWRHVITLRLVHIHTHTLITANKSSEYFTNTHTLAWNPIEQGTVCKRFYCTVSPSEEKFWYDSVSIASAARSKQRNKIKRNTYTRTHTCDYLVRAQWFNSFRLPQLNELAVRVLVQFQSFRDL